MSEFPVITVFVLICCDYYLNGWYVIFAVMASRIAIQAPPQDMRKGAWEFICDKVKELVAVVGGILYCATGALPILQVVCVYSKKF